MKTGVLAVLTLLCATQIFAGPVEDADRAYNLGHGKEAQRLALPAAKNGDDRAMVILGKIHENGMDTPQDFAKASEWYVKAVAKDNAEAMCLLASLCESGVLGAPDDAAAVELLGIAAEKGNREALWRLSRHYFRGNGALERDLEKAFHFAQKAAQAGHPLAQCYLGAAYEFGLGVEKNVEQAANWYGHAAAQGVERREHIYLLRDGD